MNKLKLILYSLFLSVLTFSNIQSITIDGKVQVSETGNGIPQATIAAVKINWGSFNSSLSTTTNDFGEYDLQFDEAGVYYFHVSHPDYKHKQFGPIEIEVDSTLNFVLTARENNNLRWLAGFVYNEITNLPISGASVELHSLNGNLIYSDETNHHGKYLIEDVETGEYILFANAEGYLEFTDTIDVGGNAIVNLYNISLTPENGTNLASLSGLVYFIEDDSLITPISGAVISLNHYLLGLHFETTSNNIGEYEFSEIPAGRYFLHVNAEGFGFTFEPPLDIEPGQNTYDIKMYEFSPPQFGGISGRVVFDNTNEPVSGVRINFHPTEGGPNFFVQPTAITDSLGHYEYQLPPWDYYVMLEYYAHPVMLNPYIEFYDDVHTFSEATPVDVFDNQITSGIDFGIPALVSNSVTVTGIVTDNAGTPLNEAMVKLIFRGHNAGHYYNDLHAYTNQNGEYSITIENVNSFNNKFIAMAKKESYIKEFYDNQPEIFLADIITVEAESDTTITGIDFSLDPRIPQEKYSISGNVIDTADIGLGGTFVAAVGFRNLQFGFAFTDSDGNYSISNLKEGTYYVLFFKFGYAPQFYDGALLWEDADPIILQSDVSGINAMLNELSFGTQPGMISGNIIDEDNSPLSGVMVSILNQYDNVVGYAMSDAEGNYSLEGLGTGNYKIYASKVNYQSQLQSILLDLTNGSSTTVNFNLPSSVTNIEDETSETPTEYELGNNYPNPFNPSTTITFNLPEAANIKLTVFNAIGQEIAELIKGNIEAGSHSVTFNAENLNSGIYFYKLEAGKFINVKKMILLK
jgi:protocatechuate 3,4-dioxygenase beta subunit